MDNLTENGKVTAEAAEAEKSEAAAVLGKFKDVQTLAKAYSELEAEFTRRCQRLKELEKENKTYPSPDGEKVKSSQSGGKIAEALADAEIRDAVIGDYLKGLAENKVPIISVGGGVPAPKNTPKTVKEAGILVRQFLKG